MTPRKRLATSGERGALVRHIQVTGKGAKHIVQWGPANARGQKSFPATKQGKADAEAFFKAFRAERAALVTRTVRDLWTAYKASEFTNLRPRTRTLYGEAWDQWEKFFGATTPAESLEVRQCGEFRVGLEAKGWALNTVRQTIRCVRGVYNWAERSELIAVNRWHRFIFKVGTGKQPTPRAEYRAEDFLKIWRALDPTDARQWRAWAITGLLGIYGNRQHAILALEWAWDCGEEIVIPASVEKTGREAILPMFPLSRHILNVCRGWCEREGYDGDKVFFPGERADRSPSGSANYTIQSYWAALKRAERKAGVPKIAGRAGHGFRRGLVGDLAEATGDTGLALQAIGDSLAMAPRYRVRRSERIRSLLSDRITRIGAETRPQDATEDATAPLDPSPEAT